MSKDFIAALLVFMPGCTALRAVVQMPTYKVGDCIQRTVFYDKDHWNKNNAYVQKILKVGKYSYKTAIDYKPGNFVFESTHDIQDDDDFERVQCPKRLEEYYVK